MGLLQGGGPVAGALGAALALRATEGIVARVPGLDAPVLGAAAIVLLLVATLAATRPARRCLSQHPVRALAAK